MSERANPFDLGDAEALEYDRWYDSEVGGRVLEAEVGCVAGLIEGAPRPWVDLGAGSGRFGGRLGADLALDAAPALLRLAARRVPSVALGDAHALPLRDGSLGGVLCVAVFEFLGDPQQAMAEVVRVLRPGGRFVLGTFPRDGAWARMYVEQGRDPRSVFHGAHFYTPGEVEAMGRAAGLVPAGARSALFGRPDRPTAESRDGADAAAGFLATAFERPRAGRPEEGEVDA